MKEEHAQQSPGGKKVLAHDPVVGYRPTFFVAFTVGVLYLMYILFRTL